MKQDNFIREIKETMKQNKQLLKPKIDYDKEYDIFYLWFGGNRKVAHTIEVSETMRFDVTKDGFIVSVEIEDLMEKLK